MKACQLEAYRGIGRTICNLRHQKKFSQLQLSDKIRVAQSKISYWEKGTHIPNILEAFKLADAFEVDINLFRPSQSDIEDPTDNKKDSVEERIRLLEEKIDLISEKVMVGNG